MTKAIYIGAGTDVQPVQRFSNITEFLYFDGQPNSEFGTQLYGIVGSNGFDGFARPRFISKLDLNMKSIGMAFQNVENNIRTYSNGRQLVKYYTNTAIPEQYESVKEILSGTDTLIINGHNPDSIFMDGVNEKLHFIGFDSTAFVIPDDEVENNNDVVYRLNRGEFVNRFSSFTYVWNNGMTTTSTWNDFVKIQKF